MKSHTSKIKNKQIERKSAIDSFELPRDIFLGLPILSLEGNRSLSITNHRGLVSYTQESIVIATAKGSIQITGCELLIPKFTHDVIEIQGFLKGILFLQ